MRTSSLSKFVRGGTGSDMIAILLAGCGQVVPADFPIRIGEDPFHEATILRTPDPGLFYLAVSLISEGYWNGVVMSYSSVWLAWVKPLIGVNDYIVGRRFRLSRVLKANSQLLGENSNTRLAEQPIMIAWNLMSFSAPREQFTPPEIGIAGGIGWPNPASKKDRRARGWLQLGRTYLVGYEFPRV
jgi:hypothetical protein